MSKPLQQFEYGTVKRSQIKFADYNPRIIDESNQKKLVKAIRENGLIEPLVWNKRTGVLVGGHQRLTAADKIYRKKDYDVPVAIIDVDEKTEKKLNVQLNNLIFRKMSLLRIWALTSLISTLCLTGMLILMVVCQKAMNHLRHQRLTMKKLKMKRIR